MRKLLVSATAAALVASPAAIAFAADEPTLDEPTLDTESHRHLRAEQLDVSRAKYKLANHRVVEAQENRRERIVERREERREAAEVAAAEAAAAEAAAAEAAPEPVSTDSTASSELSSIAECESGGDYTANTGNGFYGAYQFTPETWAGVGGSGLPSEASAAEQDMRAQMLLEQSGTSPWPVCGG